MKLSRRVGLVHRGARRERPAPVDVSATTPASARAPMLALGPGASVDPPARMVMFRTDPLQYGTHVSLVGEFNSWSPTAHPMVPHGGAFMITVDLPPGRHRYRFLFDGERWENDWHADDYEPNSFGGDDSVVVVADAPLADD